MLVGDYLFALGQRTIVHPISATMLIATPTRNESGA